MTCRMNLKNTDDRGQRYEVRAIVKTSGEQMVIGWTEKADGGGVAEMARLWPAVRDVVVIDRQAPR